MNDKRVVSEYLQIKGSAMERNTAHSGTNGTHLHYEFAQKKLIQGFL